MANKFGIAMKCVNCNHALREYKDDSKTKLKGYFCMLLKGDITLTKHSSLTACSFFEITKKIKGGD